MQNKEFGYRVEQSHASGRRYLRNPVHTQQSGVCAGGCKDRETHAPMRLEDAISVTPYIRNGAEFVRGDARIERPMPPCVWKTLSP